jgi:hypothetical protein
MSDQRTETPKPELNDVLNTLDGWLHSQRGLLAVSFTYRTTGGFEVSVDIKNGRGSVGPVQP